MSQQNFYHRQTDRQTEREREIDGCTVGRKQKVTTRGRHSHWKVVQGCTAIMTPFLNVTTKFLSQTDRQTDWERERDRWMHSWTETESNNPGEALTLESGSGMYCDYDPLFSGQSGLLIAYQFTANAPLMCLPFSIFQFFFSVLALFWSKF